MAQVIQLKDGSLHTVLGEQDILSLVEEKLGMEVRQVLEEFLFEHSEDAEYIADLEKEGALHEYYHPDTGEGLMTPGFLNWNGLVLQMIVFMYGLLQVLQ